MGQVSLEQVSRLADQLTLEEKQSLIEHLSRQVEPADSQDSAPTPSTDEQPRIPGLNAGEVWMSDDFNAELPDEFWLGNE